MTTSALAPPPPNAVSETPEAAFDVTHDRVLPAQVSIIIPAFNEAEGIRAVIVSILETLPKAEVLVVDDGSTDGTAEIARAAGARVLRHRSNKGYGASLRTAVRKSKREWVLCCDADGQHTVDDVARVIEAGGGYDMVVGARGKDSHAPWLRRPGKWVLRSFANYLAGEKIPDLNSGLRMMKRSIIKRYLHLMPTGFSFSTTSTFAFLKTQREVRWIPIKVQKRVGTSTVRQLKHGPQTLLLILRITVLFEPLKVFLTTAAALAAAAAAMLAADLVVSQGTGVGNTTVLLGVSALLVFMFGLLCDQVSAVRREKHE